MILRSKKQRLTKIKIFILDNHKSLINKNEDQSGRKKMSSYREVTEVCESQKKIKKQQVLKVTLNSYVS